MIRVFAGVVRNRTRCVRGGAIAALLSSLAACAVRPQQPLPSGTYQPPPALQDFEATAYSVKGKTAAGGRTRAGICAADPAVLPLGSRIRVHEAGEYSGEYVVTDTGRSVKGREIDIYLASDAAARRFGRKKVRVELLSSSR